MISKSIICPVCGSNKIKRIETVSSDKLTLGQEFTFKNIFYKCDACEEEGDFFAETDQNYLIAQKDAQVKLVKQLIENLNEAWGNIKSILIDSYTSEDFLGVIKVCR